MRCSVRLSQIGLLFCACVYSAASAHASDIRLGLVGTDSSHAVEFTRMLNDPRAADHVSGATVVAAYRGGNPALPLSRDRINTFSSELADRWYIPFVAGIRDLCPLVDGLLILSVDPASRLSEFQQASACGKPIFVDKPLAPTLQSVRQLARFALNHHVLWFTASAMRFTIPQSSGTKAASADVWGPGALGEGAPLDLSWYGIHSIEMLFAVMGPGARTVSRIHTSTSDVITGAWPDGRIGTVHLIRPDLAFGIAVFQNGRTQTMDNIPIDYTPLLKAVVAFVRGGASPVSARESLQVFAFMDAAQRSMQQGGKLLPIIPIKPIPIEPVPTR